MIFSWIGMLRSRSKLLKERNAAQVQVYHCGKTAEQWHAEYERAMNDSVVDGHGPGHWYKLCGKKNYALQEAEAALEEALQRVRGQIDRSKAR